MRSLARLSFVVLTALVMSVCFSATRTALAQGNGSSGIIISEFRFDGPNGTSDEFVEIVNNSSSAKTVISSDANNLKGFSVVGLVGGNAVKICTIPFGTQLLPGQHFLCAKTTGAGAYELGLYAAANDNISNYTGLGLQVDGGVALFSSEDTVVNGDGTFFSPSGTVFREDAVGFKKLNSATFDNVFSPAFREGTGLNPIGAQDPASRFPQNPNDVREYSFIRKHLTTAAGGGTYQDTNVNTADWTLVANLGDFTNFTQANLDAQPSVQGSAFDPSPIGAPLSEAATNPTFGAPGPQGRLTPIERNFNTAFGAVLFDTGSAANVSPNIERNSQPVCGGSRGDLLLRRTYKNTTTLTQANLRIRWVQLSTLGNSAAPVLTVLDSTAPTRQLFVQNGRDVRTGAAASQNDPAPSGDGITNSVAAGGAGVKAVRGTYVEGVDKTPPVVMPSNLTNPPTGIGAGGQVFSQVNPTWTDIEGNPNSPCRVGGLNSANVATPPTGAAPSDTTTALPAGVVNNGSISLEHRFGVIRGGTTVVLGIIESN